MASMQVAVRDLLRYLRELRRKGDADPEDVVRNGWWVPDDDCLAFWSAVVAAEPVPVHQPAPTPRGLVTTAGFWDRIKGTVGRFEQHAAAMNRLSDAPAEVLMGCPSYNGVRYVTEGGWAYLWTADESGEVTVWTVARL